MSGIGFEAMLVFLLVLANGAFSTAEMAVVSARKARLRQRADEGGKGAAVALDLAENPNDFLSTVQVGITLIGTLAGAVGGATIAEKVAVDLRQFPVAAPYADSIALGIVVSIITYLSLILGELVPKSVALGDPEGVASFLAPPMRWLSRIGSPAVRFLSFSTRLVMKLIPIKPSEEAPVTTEEVKVLIAQGTEHGEFLAVEQDMVERVFRLADRRVTELMRPRNHIVWLDIEDPWSVNEDKIAQNRFSRFLVADGELDRLAGVVHVNDLFAASRRAEHVDLRAAAQKPLYIREDTPAPRLLEQFRDTGEKLAVVIDEHGGVEGIVTLGGLTEALIGELGAEEARPRIAQRESGGWLVDGLVPMTDVVEALRMSQIPGEKRGFTTLAGFVLANLDRIPEPGDRFVAENWHFEVARMDGNRIDQVLIDKLTAS